MDALGLGLFFFALLLVLVLAAPLRADATTMIYADIEALTGESSWVVDGVVVDSEVFAGDHGRTTTRWRIAVMETIHGEPVEEVFVEQWVGELDGMVSRIPGDALIRRGERSVFFLSGDSPERLFLTAMGQARFVLQPSMPGDEGSVLQADEVLLRPGALRHMLRQLDFEGADAVRDLSEISFYDIERDAPLYHLHHPEVLRRHELVQRVRDAAAGGAR